MSALITTLKATIADIPFLTQIEYEALLPPLDHCFWEDLLEGMGTTALEFIEAELRIDASNWGNVTELQHLPLHWFGMEKFVMRLREQGYANVALCANYRDGLQPTSSDDQLCFSATLA